VAGGKMKVHGTDYWKWPNAGATNSSGFSALPGGTRWSLGFHYIEEIAGFWTSSGKTSTSAWSQTLTTYDLALSDGTAEIIKGLSVRCIRD